MQWLTLVSSQQEGCVLDPQPKGLAEWSLHELSRCSPPSSHSPKRKVHVWRFGNSNCLQV